MKGMIQMELVRAIYQDRLRQAEASRRRLTPAVDESDIRIRRAARADSKRLKKLADLDSAPVPAGPTLVAELDGQLVAALPIRGGRAVADPFVPSGPLVQILELRAAQLRTVG